MALHAAPLRLFLAHCWWLTLAEREGSEGKLPFMPLDQ
jgi:hypothetical protein